MVKPIVEEVEGEARARIAEGFARAREIVESIVERFSDEHDPAELRPLAERLTAAALAEHLEAQQRWPIPTDCDRLDRAFGTLEKVGIVARQNFTCCQSCGAAEISDEGDGDGYTFYHSQDTESASDGGHLFLSYGSLRETVDPVEIGQRVAAALRREGLAVEWDGQLEQRILVRLKWRRRRSPNG
jgi:hypothetical protein